MRLEAGRRPQQDVPAAQHAREVCHSGAVRPEAGQPLFCSSSLHVGSKIASACAAAAAAAERHSPGHRPRLRRGSRQRPRRRRPPWEGGAPECPNPRFCVIFQHNLGAAGAPSPQASGGVPSRRSRQRAQLVRYGSQSWGPTPEGCPWRCRPVAFHMRGSPIAARCYGGLVPGCTAGMVDGGGGARGYRRRRAGLRTLRQRWRSGTRSRPRCRSFWRKPQSEPEPQPALSLAGGANRRGAAGGVAGTGRSRRGLADLGVALRLRARSRHSYQAVH